MIQATNQPLPTANRRPRTRCAVLPAVLLAGLVYAITLGGTYVYDDLSFVHDDPRLHAVDQWGRFWSEPYHQGVDILYRPLTTLSFAVQWWLHGERLWAFHLVNILLHMGVTALVAGLGCRLGGPKVGLLAGLLFAVHPVHVEAVAGLVGRAELLCALGTLGALRLWLHRPLGIGRALAIGALFLLAALSKEQGLLLPLLLAAALPWRASQRAATVRERDPSTPPLPDGRASLRPPRDAEYPLVRLTLVALMFGFAAYVLWRESHADLRISWDPSWIVWSNNPIVEATGANRLLLPVTVAGRYAALLTVPLWLSLDYGGHVIGPVARWNDPYLWIGFAALTAALATTAIALIRRRFDLLLLLLGLGLSYGLISNLVLLIGTIMAERLLYLPSAFFAILAAYALGRLPRAGLWTVMAMLLGLWTWRTVSYAALWNRPESLYRYLLAEHPESARGYRLTAQERFRADDRQAGWEILGRGLARIDDDPDFWFYAVRRALLERNYDGASALLDRAEHQERLRQRRRGIQRPRAFEEIDIWRERVAQLRAR